MSSPKFQKQGHKRESRQSSMAQQQAQLPDHEGWASSVLDAIPDGGGGGGVGVSAAALDGDISPLLAMQSSPPHAAPHSMLPDLTPVPPFSALQSDPFWLSYIQSLQTLQSLQPVAAAPAPVLAASSSLQQSASAAQAGPVPLAHSGPLPRVPLHFPSSSSSSNSSSSSSKAVAPGASAGVASSSSEVGSEFRYPPFFVARDKNRVIQKTKYEERLAQRNVSDLLTDHRLADVKNIILSEPSIKGQLALVGNANDKAERSFFACFDTEIMRKKEQSPLVGCLMLPPELYVRCLCWLNPNDPRDYRAVVGTGGGGENYLRIFSIEAGQGKISQTGVMKGVTHRLPLRELSASPYRPSEFASGGNDGDMCISNADTFQTIRRVSFGKKVSSVKWSHAVANWLGVTLDNCDFYIMDPRTAAPNNLHIERKTPNLYTHEHYGMNSVLLGYSNGVMEHFDLRHTAEPLFTVEDPFCYGIGAIECRQSTKALLTSGYNDFSVWRPDFKNNRTTVWSHSIDYNFLSHEESYHISAAWVDDDTVFAASSSGYIGLWKQGFLENSVAEWQPFS